MDSAALNTVTSDAALVTAILRLLGDNKARQKAALADCHQLDPKITLKTETRIGLYDQISIIANATEMLGPDWPYQVPDFWHDALDNIFGTTVRSAPTLGEGLDVVTRYSFLWSPALYFEDYAAPNSKTFLADVVVPDGMPPRIAKGLDTLREMAVIATYLVLDETLKGRWNGARIFLAASPKRKVIANFYKAEIVWESPRFGFELPACILKRKSQQADPARFRKSSLAIQNLVFPPDIDRSLEETVSAYINATQYHRPTINEVARSMGMSTRTLNRRLEQSGISFRRLLEQSLQNRTRMLLNQGQLSRGEIAERLGYKDQASFSRALRRWQVERS